MKAPRLFSPPHRRLAAASIFVGLAAAALAAQPAVRSVENAAPIISVLSQKPGSIRFGMSTALSGPAATLGINMSAGVQAAFDEANRAGGINGRTIELIVRDDAYEPSKTGPAVRELVGKENVLAIVGNVGTPTAVVALPICRESKTPFIGAFTGASILRPSAGAPSDPIIFNYRASYAEEIGGMVDALLANISLHPTEIAFFTQRDAYGDAGFAGGLAALKRHGMPEGVKPLHVRYERNTLAVESAVASCMTSNPRPKAVIMIGAYAPCAAFIRLCRESEYRPLFLNVSFVGAESLASALGKDAEGVIVTQVVPTFDTQPPIMARYRAALAALPDGIRTPPSLGSFEGYAVGRIVCAALESCTNEPTRLSLARAMEALGTFDIGLDQPLSLGPSDHQACHKVWPSVLLDGKAVSFDWKNLPTLLTRSEPTHAAQALEDEPARP